MPTFTQHPAGNFVWFELATTDPSAAKSFYASLCGWEATDSPMGPDMVYTMFRLQGRDVAGGFQLSAQERSAGIPPHWQLYIAVDNADASVSRAVELGGKAIAPAFDIPNVGRMAVLQDPTGAMVSIFQPGNHKGVGLYGETGAFCWADLQTPDRDRAVPFYSALFGWQILPGKDKDPSSYLHIKNGEEYIGGLPEPRTLPPGVPAHWLPYIQSADCAADTAKAKEAGARILVPPTTVEGQLQFAVLADPQGAVFALFTPAH